MARISYVNGRYLDHSEALVHAEDRGYQFADGVYEYIAFYNRTVLGSELHWQRLARSLKALSIAQPVSSGALDIIVRELIERNGREHGGIYLQITRGVSRRDHPFPKNIKPSLVITLCGPKIPKPSERKDGVKVMTYPDNRWSRRDIKSISLLANVIAKQEASKHHLREAWLIDGDVISEGSVSNAYIVDSSGALITHPADERILGGITRDVVLRLARGAGIAVKEKAFTPTQMHAAAEAFITSTSANVLPVVKIDDKIVGKGVPGEVTRTLQRLYEHYIFQQTGYEF